MLELEPEPLGPFPQSLRLTKAGDVTLVPVPGHTPGQIGVLVDEGDQTVFLAGDSSYTQDLMLRGKADGVGSDDDAERLTPPTDPRLRSRDAHRLPAGPRPRHSSSVGIAPADRSCAGEGDRVMTFDSQRTHRASDRRGVRVCREPALVPAVELCRPDRAPRFGGERRPRFDVLDASTTTGRPSRERARGPQPRAPHEVRHPHDVGTDTVSLRIPIRP